MSNETGDVKFTSSLNSPSVDSKIAAELEVADANSPVYSTRGATGRVNGDFSSDSPQHNSARGFLNAPTARVAQSADGSFLFDDSYNAIVPFGRDRPSSASGLGSSGGPLSDRHQHLSSPSAAAATEPRGLLDDLTDAPEVVYRDSPRDRASFFTSPRRAHSEGAKMREEKETLVRTASAGRTTKTTTTTTSKVGQITNRTTRVTSTRHQQQVGGSATAWEGGAVATSSSELCGHQGSHDAGTTKRLDAGGSEDGLAGVGDDFTSVSGSDDSDDDNRADEAPDAVASPLAAGCTSRVSRAVAAVRHDKSHGWAPVWRRLIARITVALRAARALRRAEQNLRFRARRDGIEVAELMSRGTVAARIALELRHLMALYACWTQEAFDFAAIFDGFVKELPSIGAKTRGAMAMHVSCHRVIRKTGSTDAAGHLVVDDGSSFGRIAGGATSDLSGIVVPVRDASEPLAFDLFPAGPTHTEDRVRMMLQPHMLPRKGRGEITIAFDWDFTVDDSVEPSPSPFMIAGRDDAKRHTALLHRRMLATEHERRATAIAAEESASRRDVMAVFARQTARFALLRLEQTSRTPTLTLKAGSGISPAQRMRNEAAATTTAAAGVAKVKTNRAAGLLRERNARAPPKSSPPRSPGARAAKATSKASASPVPRTPPAAKSPSSRSRRSPSARMPSAAADVKVNAASRSSPTASSGGRSETASPPTMSWVMPAKTPPNDRDPAAHSRTARPVQLDQSDEIEHSAAPDSSPGRPPVSTAAPAQASLPQPEHHVPSEDVDGPSVLWRSRPGSRLRLVATVSHAPRQSSAAPSRAGSPTHSEASAHRLERRPSRISFRCSPAAQPLAPSVHASAGPLPNDDDASPDPRPLRVVTPEDDRRVASHNRRRMSIRHLRERGNSVANSPQEAALIPVSPTGVRPAYSRSSLSSHTSPTKPEPAGPFRLTDGEGDVEDGAPADAGKSRILTDYVFGASVDSACDDDDGDAAAAAAKVGDASPASDGDNNLRRRVSLPRLRQPGPAHVTTEAAKKQRLRTTLSMRRLRQEQAEDRLVGQDGLQSDLFDPRAALAEAQRLRSQASRRDAVTRYNTSAAILQPGATVSSGYRARLQRTISASRSPSPALSLASQQRDQHHQHGDGEAKRVRHCTACANRKRVAEERVVVPGGTRTTSPKPRSTSPSPVTPPLSPKPSDVRLPAIGGGPKDPRSRQPVRTRRSSSVVALRAALDGADL